MKKTAICLALLMIPSFALAYQRVVGYEHFTQDG